MSNRLMRLIALLAILALPGEALADWNGSGTFTRTNGVFTGANVWVNDRDAGVKIRADRQDTHDQDLATGINNTLTKDGQNTPTANLPMGGFRHTAPGAATARDQYGRVAETQDSVHVYAADTGTANVYAIALSPAITAYATGQRFVFKALNANSGASTLNVNTLGAKSVLKHHDQALVSGDIEALGIYEVVYDGTGFQLVSPLANAPAGGTLSNIVEDTTP